MPGFDFAEVMPASAGGAISAETLFKAELVVKFLTCASTQVCEASQVPPGEQYSWHEILRMRPADRQKHVEAMQAEIDKLITAGHMEWADLPAGEIAIPAVGVFRLKSHDIHAQGKLLKARMCLNGKQTDAPPGGWESTANVATIAQILTVIAIETDLGLTLKQIDVKSAFTQVKLPDGEEIYLQPLPGMNDAKNRGRVLKLLHHLYGHHLYGHPLANAAWSKMWLDIVTKFGFKVVDRQGTVFSYRHEGTVMLMATVVDDSVIAFNDESVFNKFIEHVQREVPIAVTDLEYICGLRVKCDAASGVTTVDQTEYIENKAALFGIKGEGFVYNTPMEQGFKFSDRPESVNPEFVAEARSLNGSLIYATLTLPDVKFPCSKLASVVTNPT